MKIYKYIAVVAVAAMAMLSTACSDFLDKDPENSVPEESVDFTQISNMYMPVSGVYANVRTGAMHWVIWGLVNIKDDDCWSGRVDDQATMVDLGNFIYDSSFWGINEMWNQFYGIIKTANGAIESLESYAENCTSSTDLATNRAYQGEVRFIRAWVYYMLTRQFGDVTIIRTNTQSDLRRSNIELVRDYIIEDLEYAIANCPKVRPNEATHFGAVTSYSASALAAKVSLDRGDWAAAEAYSNDVINSGRFELYDDYYELFKIPGKVCNESLWEAQATDFGNGSGDLVNFDAWHSFQGPANNGNISGWGFMGYYKSFREWAKERGETVRYTTSFLEAGTTTPSGDSIRPLQNPTQTDCWNGKAYTPTNELTEGRTGYGTNNNIRIIRYADILLVNAEAKVRQGKNGDEQVNLVRRRAKLSDLTNATVDQILDERRMELCMEWGERYNDLIRTGKAATVFAGTAWDESKTYYPLPFNQTSNYEDLNLEPYQKN